MDKNWKNRTTKFLIAQTISLFGSSIVQYAIIYYITLNSTDKKFYNNVIMLKKDVYNLLYTFFFIKYLSYFEKNLR